MEIKRDYYLNLLAEKQHNGMIKVITGIRRCGKSYLLNNIFYNYLLTQGIDENHIIKFAFDSADDLSMIGENLIALEKEKRKVNPELFMKYIRSRMTDEKMYYLLLDEIQLLDCFESVLNGYLRKPNMDVYVTGSNAKMLSKDIITEFAARGDQIELFPLSFSEFMSVYPADVQKGLNEYLTYGGIPIVVIQKNREEKIKILNSLFTEIYIKDIIKRNKLKKQLELEQLMNMISSAVGSLTNPENLKNSFRSLGNSKISSATIKKYLDCFEDAFLMKCAKRYNLKGKSYISTTEKYYYTDLGLRNARINFRQQEYSHLMENMIYNELRIIGMQVDVGVVPIRESLQNGVRQEKLLEIDFVCNIGDRRIYIQSAYSLPDEAKRLQEIRPFMNVNDSFRKIIITRDYTESYMDDNGILTVNIADFLLNIKEYTKS